jgi:hypothetical protein
MYYSDQKRGRKLRPAVENHSVSMEGEGNSSAWLNKLLERSTRTSALRKVQPHMPRRHQEVGGNFQRNRLRASRPQNMRSYKPIGSFPLSPPSALSSSYRTTIQKKSTYGSSNNSMSPLKRGSGRGGREYNQHNQQIQQQNKQNRRIVNDELSKLADIRLTSNNKSNYNMERSSLEPKQLYLLNQFMGFDKFTGVEREDLVDLMVDQWMTDPYVGDEYRQHVELYCESSFSIDRRSSKREFPNRLNTAVCCDMLQLIARKETKYRRALKLVKAGIFASIFQDYKEADESGQTFLEMTPFYTVSKEKDKKLDQAARRNNQTSWDERDEGPERNGRTGRNERNERNRRSKRQESKPADKKEMLISILRDMSPSDAAELIELQCGYNYRKEMSDKWSNMSIPQQTSIDDEKQDRSSVNSAGGVVNVEITAPENEVVSSTNQVSEIIDPVCISPGDSPGVHELDSLTEGQIIPKPDPVETYSKDEIAAALSHLVPSSEGHGQKVLLYSIGIEPDQDHSLLNQTKTIEVEKELPKLEVPKTQRRRTEDDQKENRSFMEDSDSHAQKVLIHSLAMDDNELFKLLETPDEIMHSSHQDPNLRITKHDRATSSPFELLLDDSVGHTQRVLIHSLTTVSVEKGDDKYGPVDPE